MQGKSGKPSGTHICETHTWRRAVLTIEKKKTSRRRSPAELNNTEPPGPTLPPHAFHTYIPKLETCPEVYDAQRRQAEQADEANVAKAEARRAKKAQTRKEKEAARRLEIESQPDDVQQRAPAKRARVGKEGGTKRAAAMKEAVAVLQAAMQNAARDTGSIFRCRLCLIVI